MKAQFYWNVVVFVALSLAAIIAGVVDLINNWAL